jgi:transcriptional regulator with XRE-family HTH domain
MQDYEQREPKDLGHALTWLRQERRLTQQEVVERAGLRSDGISKIYYSQIERGVRKPSPGKLQNILSALGTSEQELERVLDAPPWSTPPQSTPLPSQPQSPDKSRVRMRSLSPKPATLWEGALGAVGASAGPESSAAASTANTSDLPHWSTEAEELVTIYNGIAPGDRINLMAYARSLRKKS